MGKRKSATLAQESSFAKGESIPPPSLDNEARPAKRRASQRQPSQAKAKKPLSTNPDENANVLDAPGPLRASPDADENDERMDLAQAGMDVENQIKNEKDDEPLANGDESDSPLSELESPVQPEKAKKPGQAATKVDQKQVKSESKPSGATKTKNNEPAKDSQFLDPEADDVEEADEEEIQAALLRPPPVNSDYLPLPWKGRIGYACLCTYLRFSNPPVFTSRTCRIASILENRHPLKDPNAPPHATKNRPDKEQPASIERGQQFVESLGLANARDIVKMLRWNDRYGIKFMRLSSEMFPFASHPEYGYKLAPFAAEALAEAGKVAAELGHRLTTHPGQFTQLGSPRKQVIDNAFRDLEYHAELLDLLKLPPQQDRDAVMILHMGGIFGDKPATLDRFRENYAKLPPNVKKRLVLENDDVCYSVHDLLPVCEELNIPLVLDFHHHNIVFDADQIREGTRDIMDLFPRILATWKRKNIAPKMHYSEPTPAAITGRQRRKHSARVATLPPCPPDMDLMIEAKDKEQAVFELMRIFKLPGFDSFNDIVPHVRQDDNKPVKTPKKKKKTPTKKTPRAAEEEPLDEDGDSQQQQQQAIIEDADIGMGGPEGRVYWPPGMEEWLRPVKRVVKPKDPDAKPTPAPAKKGKKAAAAAAEAKLEEEVKPEVQEGATPAQKGKKAAAAAAAAAAKNKKKKKIESVPTPSTSDHEVEADEGYMTEKKKKERKKRAPAPRRQSRGKKIDYKEQLDEDEEEEGGE
ncbi:MAG: hypothetical protein Q9191_002925 [Dirinaria sp. TL-2023a]